VAQQVPERHLGVPDVTQVLADRVVERQQAGVARLHHEHRRERLRDGTDPVLPVDPGAEPARPGPHDAVPVEDGTHHRRQAPLGLGHVEADLPAFGHGANAR